MTFGLTVLKSLMIKINAPIKPVPFPRPASNETRRYNPPRYREFKDTLGLYAKLAMKGREPFAGEVKLHADFYKCKPKKITSRNWGDLDNHLKSVLDSLSNIIYYDDSQVIEVSASKHFGEPKIIICVEEVNGENENNA